MKTSMSPLSRRACLKGMGVSLALPLLVAMAPRRASAAAAAPLRFLTYYVPNGIYMQKWRPKTAGAAYEMTPLLAPIAPYRADCAVISGLANYPASIVSKEFAGSHARATGALLTQTPLAFTAGVGVKNGVSLDQVIAARTKSETRLPSLQLGTRAGSTAGDCEDGFSCAYLHNLSWADASTPLRKQTSPKDVFDRLFAPGAVTPTPMPGMPPARPDPTALYERSILDLVAGRAADLQKRLGRTDRQKLDQYLTMVREVEVRIDRQVMATMPGTTTPPPPASACPSRPGGDFAPAGMTYQQHLDLMADLMVLAFACDQTRVITFMAEDALDGSRSYSFLGVSGQHHEISHHGGSPDKLAKLEAIDRFEMERFAYLLGKLKATMEGPASLLERSIVLFTSDFGDGDDHYHWDLPVLLAGHGGGQIKTGQHIVYPHSGADGPSNKADMPMANLFLNVLHAFGIEQGTFGSDGSAPYGTKALAELQA
jgi:hypothetical protein